MREQIKTPEKQPIKMEISNLSDAKFKTLVVTMFQELSEDLKNIKKIPSVIKDSLIEIKSNLQGNNSRLDAAENQINDLEHKNQKTTNQNNKMKKKSKQTRIVKATSGTT